MKKLILSLSIFSVFALAFTIASPVSAFSWHFNRGTTVVSSNEASVGNTVNAMSNTGSNTAEDNDDGTSIVTGPATSMIDLQNGINDNSTILRLRGRIGSLKVISKNSAEVMNVTTSTADTGNNTANENDDDTSVTTGEAASGITIANMVNSNMTRIFSSSHFHHFEDVE
jgi:uncharacterized membrane protein